MARSPFLIKIPSGLEPWEADNWRAVAEALKMALGTTNAVDSPTTGLSAVQGKVRVDQYDTTPEYLDQKIVEGNNIDFIKSNDGMGAKEIKAHFKLVVSTSEPTSPTEGMFWFDSDARFGTPFTIGDGETGIDYELKFDGETNDGSLYWMEDEDYFKIVDDLLVNSSEAIYFRDTAISIKSADDGHLDLTADTSIDINGALTHGVSVQTTTYGVAATDYVIVCNSATAFTVTIPTAAATGRILIIKNINIGSITVSKSGDTIDGAASQVLNQWDAITLCDYAANAWIIL